jgi:hypothetical protein
MDIKIDALLSLVRDIYICMILLKRILFEIYGKLVDDYSDFDGYGWMDLDGNLYDCESEGSHNPLAGDLVSQYKIPHESAKKYGYPPDYYSKILLSNKWISLHSDEETNDIYIFGKPNKNQLSRLRDISRFKSDGGRIIDAATDKPIEFVR